jgi:hypothetical protein
MPLLDDRHVLVEGATVVWDAITRPEKRDDGSESRKLKVVIPANSPDAPLIEQLAQQCLAESKWRGTLPNGANWAISQVQPGEYNNQFVGGWVINPSSNRVPDIYDENGNQLTDPMQYGSLIYQGQLVSVIVHCWDYDNKSKGIATGLDGVKIHVSANAPRQQFGGGGFNAGSVFGNGGGQQMQQGQQPMGGQPMQQGQQPTGGQPMQQGQQPMGGQPMQQGQQPMGGQPMQQGQQPMGGQQMQQGQQPMGGQPMQQAQNFLPQQ